MHIPKIGNSNSCGGRGSWPCVTRFCSASPWRRRRRAQFRFESRFRKSRPGDASSGPAARVETGPCASPAPAQRSDNGSRRDVWAGSQPRAQGTAVPRAVSPSVRNGGAYRNDAYRYSGNRNYGYSNNGYHNYSYRGGYYARPPVHFYHPYYSFRPRFSVGFGLWLGYPVPYALLVLRPVLLRFVQLRLPGDGVPVEPVPGQSVPVQPVPGVSAPDDLSAVVAALPGHGAGSELDRRSAGAGESRRPEFRHHAAGRSGAGGR